MGVLTVRSILYVLKSKAEKMVCTIVGVHEDDTQQVSTQQSNRSVTTEPQKAKQLHYWTV